MIDSIKVLDRGEVALIDHMGNDQSIVNSARISYSKGAKKVSNDRDLIRYLMRHRHTSPLEHVEFQFYVKAPIFIFRQWHRHRTWAFSEISGRYSDLPEEFYVPEENKITKQSKSNKQGGSEEILEYARSIQQSFFNESSNDFSRYNSRLKSGMRKELARINLPLSTYSEMYAKVDLHNLFHFLSLRLDSHAQYEIRVYAEAIAELIKPIVPLAWEAFEDYKLNSINLSSLDIESIQKIMADFIGRLEYDHEFVDSIIEMYSQNISNKREKSEFIDKIGKLLKV